MWEARFADGQAADESIVFAVGEPFTTIYLMPVRGPTNWMRVGDENLVPETPPPGMVTYERRFVTLENGTPVAVYEQTEKASQSSFTCPRCQMTSSHPVDVAQGYCGNCHDWTRWAQ